MKWKRVGECRHCGRHCRDVIKWMKGPRSICRYAEQKDSIYDCRIRREVAREHSKPKWLPTKHYLYWLNECVPFPDPEDPAHCPPVWYLYPECGYKIVQRG